MDTKKNSESNTRAIVHLFEHWTTVSRLLIFIMCSMLILWGAVVSAVWLIRPALRGIRLVTLSSGAQVFEVGDHRTVQWLYSASSKPYPLHSEDRAERIWSNSGIQVAKGEKIRFYVSGAVNLAIHHLVESAISDSLPYFHWIGPDGLTEEQKRLQRPADKVRTPYRIAPGWNQGILLMQIVPPGKKPWIIPEPDEENNRLYKVGSGSEGEVRVRQCGTLYFALNEVPLGPDRKDVYIITQEEDPDYADSLKGRDLIKQEEAWLEIEKNEYWDIWFDDNVGSFLIIAEIE